MSLLIRGSQWWALKGAIIFLSFFLPGSRTLRPFGVIQHSESTDAMGGGADAWWLFQRLRAGQGGWLPRKAILSHAGSPLCLTIWGQRGRVGVVRRKKGRREGGKRREMKRKKGGEREKERDLAHEHTQLGPSVLQRKKADTQARAARDQMS